MSKSKFPLLEQLRAERCRHEDAITAPFRELLGTYRGEIARLTSRVRTLEHFVGLEIAKHVCAEIAHDLQRTIRDAVMKALAAVGCSGFGEIAVHVPVDVMRLMDPNSIERSVVDEYVQQQVPDMSVNSEIVADSKVMVLDVRIPKVGIRRTIAA